MSMSREEDLLNAQIREVKAREELWKKLTRLVEKVESEGLEGIRPKSSYPNSDTNIGAFVERECPESKIVIPESEILRQMNKIKESGLGYENWSDTALRKKAVEILEDDIPF